MSNDRISMLARTLIPQRQIKPDKKYINVSEYYIAFYRDKRGKKRRGNADEYNFGIFRTIHNERYGTYFRSIDNKLFGFFDPDNSIKVNIIKSEVEYKVNCSVISASSFDNVRLLLRNCNYIDDYVPGKATKEEIVDVLAKVKYYHQRGVNYLPELKYDENKSEKRRRS